MPTIDPSVPLMLDRVRHIRLDIEALCEAEDALSTLRGKDISVYEVLMQSPIRLNDLCIIVHHGLLHEDASLTLADVKRLMNNASMPTILQAVTDSWTIHTRAADAQEGVAQPGPPAVPIGADSGPLPASSLGSVVESSGD